MDSVDKAIIETFINAVGNFGFPLVLAVYLLLRFEKNRSSNRCDFHFKRSDK